MWGAVYGAATLYAQALAAIPPEQRYEHFLNNSPEVRLAREYIAADGLRKEFAEQLLSFARHLAEQRLQAGSPAC